MLGSTSAIRAFSLQRWARLPAPRVRCLRHFLALAATLAAAKVLLSTIGVTLFVAEQGAAGLPPFYVGFSAIAILLSFGLTSIIDRAPKVRLAQITFAGLLLGTAALRLLIALEVPGVSFALLASATAFEIVLDIVFWVVVAAYLDAFEFRRVTPLVYMALALGGAAGGAVARVGAGFLTPADLLLLLFPLAGLVVVQFAAVATGLREVPENHPDTADEAEASPGLVLLGRLLKRYPLALLIALNALVVTLLYGLSEFLILSIYEARFTSEAELAEFLSLLFALMQIVEFGLLYTLTRVLLERTGPLLRNLVFPLTSLAGLVFLVTSPRLLAAVVVHVNIEAASNAIFLPISNANYVPLPLGFQGRARTLSEGIFYPTGLALAGAVLWTADPEAAVLQAEFAALIFAGLFVLLGAGVGLLFVPTLRANVGSGLVGPGQTTAVAMPAPPAPRVRALLGSRESELRLLGLTLAQHLDPRGLEDDLLALARHADRAIRTALARLIAAAPGLFAQNLVDRCLAGESEEEFKLALLVMLIRRAALKPEQVPRVLGAHDPAVVVLGHVVAEGLEAWTQIQPLIRRPEVAPDLIDAIVCAKRTDCTPLLLACLEAAEPEQQRYALAMLNAYSGSPRAATTGVVRLLARHRSSAVRAEAIVLLSRMIPGPAAVRELIAALDDLDGGVRRRAAEALCQHGNRATALLRHRLCPVTMASPDAVWALARIASPPAHRLLDAYVRQLQQDAERTARLLASTAVSPDRTRCSGLELCLRDHKARIVDVVLTALSPSIEARLSRRLRDALQGADQRGRASAFELIAAGPASRLAPGAVALLRYLLFEDGVGQLQAPRSEVHQNLIDQTVASMSPWVRRAAARPAVRDFAEDHSLIAGPEPASVPSRRRAAVLRSHDMIHNEQDLERVLVLKRIPLFRCLPLDTLLAVARSVDSRQYGPGDVIVTSGERLEHCHILEAGAVSIERCGSIEPLAAPACFNELVLIGEDRPDGRIVALEPCCILRLHAVVLQDLARDYPDILLELCRNLVRRVRAAEGADDSGGSPILPAESLSK